MVVVTCFCVSTSISSHHTIIPCAAASAFVRASPNWSILHLLHTYMDTRWYALAARLLQNLWHWKIACELLQTTRFTHKKKRSLRRGYVSRGGLSWATAQCNNYILLYNMAQCMHVPTISGMYVEKRTTATMMITIIISVKCVHYMPAKTKGQKRISKQREKPVNWGGFLDDYTGILSFFWIVGLWRKWIVCICFVIE